VDEKAELNASYNVAKLLPNLIKDCNHLLSDNFIFQQDGAPAHTAALAQDWIKKKYPGFIWKHEWPTNLPDLNPLDYHVWGAMLGRYQKTDQHCLAEDCLVIDMKWFATSSLITQSCHFERDFDRVLLQLADILNTQFKYRESSWHSSLKRLNCWRKSCAKFDLLLLNIQDATACFHAEKVNFKV